MTLRSGRRKWVKLWTYESLTGTLREELTPAERSVWWDFLALAGESPEPGTICIYPKIGFSDQQLCELLRIDMQLLKDARSKLLETGRITMNENGIIHIQKWKQYQSEYERTKKYTETSTSESTPRGKVDNLQQNLQQNLLTEEEEEEEREGEGEKKEDISTPLRGADFPSAFDDWEKKLNAQSNRSKKIGVLVEAFRNLHSRAPTEDFEKVGDRLGYMAKGGNEGYVLKLLWQSASEDIKGSHLDYIQRMRSKITVRDPPGKLPTSEELERSWKK